jgi:hypothetical protein
MPAVVIAATNLMPSLQERLADEGELLAFADTEPIQALQAILERRHQVCGGNHDRRHPASLSRGLRTSEKAGFLIMTAWDCHCIRIASSGIRTSRASFIDMEGATW